MVAGACTVAICCWRVLSSCCTFASSFKSSFSFSSGYIGLKNFVKLIDGLAGFLATSDFLADSLAFFSPV